MAGPPALHLLDLPPLPGVAPAIEADPRPLLAVSGDPWRGAEVLAGARADIMTRRASVTNAAGVGVTLTGLVAGPLHRLHRQGRVTARMEGARLQSRSWLEVAAGANALAVLRPGGEWEVIQFLEAELIAPETYQLRRLLRGQAGTEAAEVIPAGAPAVLLDEDLVRADVGPAEQGAQLLWRAAPKGSVHAVSTTEAEFTWRGLHARPWPPAHLRGRLTPEGGLRLTWVRRARIGGDAWSGEPPLGEDAEAYRVDAWSGATRVRSWETAIPEPCTFPSTCSPTFLRKGPNSCASRCGKGRRRSAGACPHPAS